MAVIGLPYTLEIPTPMPSMYKRGYEATTTFERHAKFRCNARQLAEIDAGAASCGMKRADFLRFCALETAKEIARIRHKLESKPDTE